MGIRDGRACFCQRIADTCFSAYDNAWSACQWEIGRRHWTDKHQANAPASDGTPPFILWRYLNALVYPITVTHPPFLEQGATDAAQAERMGQA